MKKEMNIIVNRTTNEMCYTYSKSDIAAILECSLSTVIRKYSNKGTYESGIYLLYISVDKYNNGQEKHYNHDVKPPIVNTIDNQQRHETPNNVVIMETNDQVVSHDIEEQDLVDSQYDAYYSTKSYAELTKSKQYYRLHPKRLAVIDKYGAIRQAELF